MTATAILSVNVTVLTYEHDLAGGARIVGNIYPADASGAGLRNVVFPCGPGVRPARYEVEPGRYVVSATLPSGVVLSEDAEAREGEETPVVLDASESPYETHAWQYLMGNIESRPVYHGPVTAPVPRSTGSRCIGTGLQQEAAPAPGRSVKATWISDATPESWTFEAMNALVAEPTDASIADEVAAAPHYVLPRPDETDGTSHLFRFGGTKLTGPVGWPTGRRQFLLVEMADTAHLATLPVPWGSARVEILVNARQSPTGSPVAVTVRDRAVGAGLAYMARGALDLAAALFTDVESMLFGERRNRLAATAGAYVLVGTDLADGPRPWDPLLVSLRERYPWMSDGSVLWAVRQLRRATTQTDRDTARAGLIEAYDRGVPLYTLGLSWLIDGLSEFPDDPECVRRLGRARQLSWRVDMREPFVIVSVRRGRT
ncbi:hypothetical protein ACWGI8_35930 [Streptomyces sp. NPDC054841]